MNRRRAPIVGLLIVSLVLAGLTRHWAAAQRARSAAPGVAASAAGLGRMNSFALALLLGGLRGPLVMFLWPSAEQQKAEKNLEDFDTKIEWIRLLQAEFDTVHIFQIWNKAYNISVQMANLGNKYRTILDALDYAHSVDAERPNNINILTAIGQIHFDKLGNSAEKNYYRQRIRDESRARADLLRITLPADRQKELTELALRAGASERQLQFIPDEKNPVVSITLPKPIAELIQPGFTGPGITYADRPRQRLSRDNPAWRRLEMDPILDAQGDLLPGLVKSNNLQAAGQDPTQDTDVGEFHYLRRYQPFAYGVSPFALAYDYYKRAQVLQEVGKQKHAQLSDLVVDSRPALALKNWSEEEWERARKAELEAFGQHVPAERLRLELPTADIKPDAPVARRQALDEALFSYQRSARLGEDAIVEYERHLRQYKTNITTYMSHIDTLRAQGALCSADHDYLKAMVDPAQRRQLMTSAADHYRRAAQRFALIALQYYVTDELVTRLYPPGVTRSNIAQAGLSPQQLTMLVEAIRQSIPSDPNLWAYGDDFLEYYTYIQRIQKRLENLK